MSRRATLLYLSTAGAVVAIGAFVNRHLLWPPTTLLVEVPKSVTEVQPELNFAIDQYNKKGGKYIWGSNDCSVFVADYIKACRKPVRIRPTTETMMRDPVMRSMGFQPVTEDPAPGDILVYRYQNTEGQWRGHTGIVVWYKNDLWVAHNAASFDGLVVQHFDKFVDLQNKLTRGKESLSKRYRRSDFQDWYADFETKRNQTL